MPYTYKSFSTSVSSSNQAPDLIVLENSFIGKDGKCQAVDGDLELKLYNYGSDDQVGLTYKIGDATNPIEVISRSAGLYYFARANPTIFNSSTIVAKWFAKIDGKNLSPYPDVKILGIGGTGEELLLPGIIRDYVLRSLGYPKLSVELDESQINQSIEQVLAIYNKWIPKIGYGKIDLVSTSNTYTIPNWGKGIIGVDFVRKEGMPFVNDPMFGKQYPRSQTLDFDQFILGISFYKTLLKQTGQDPEWKWDSAIPDKIRLQVRNATSYYVTYRYLTDNRLEEINPSHHQLFKDLVLAKCMIILGRIRSKFGDSIATPTGDKSLDGAALIQQGMEMEKDKEQQIRDMMMRVPPIRY